VKERAIVVVSTDLRAAGGIAAVVGGYRLGGLDVRWPIRYLTSHREGTSLKKAAQFAVAILTFSWMLVRGDVAVLHAHSASRTSFFRKSSFALLSRIARVPVILHIHGGAFERFYGREIGRVGRAYVRLVFRHVNLVLVLSESWKSALSMVVDPRKIVVVKNGVPLGRALSRQPNKDHDQIILFLGRISDAKGFFDLLQVVGRLRANGAGVFLWAGGDGDLDRAASYAHELGIGDRIRLLGWVVGDTKTEIMNDATVFCLPSYSEGLPVALLEAMSAGLPVITTAVGGIPEAVTHGVEGFLCEPGDLDAMHNLLLELVESHDLRTAMGQAARRRIEAEFSLPGVMSSLADIYIQLGARPREPSRTQF